MDLNNESDFHFLKMREIAGAAKSVNGFGAI
jgi:hypothetical protein